MIKVGLNPILIGLLEEGFISALALNGAGVIHDSELAMVGRTSEDVDQELGRGTFGMAKETALFLNQAISRGAGEGRGLGEAVGMALLDSSHPHLQSSLLATAARKRIPVTVHVAIGTDIIHLHPSMDPEATGPLTGTSNLLFRGRTLEEGYSLTSVRPLFFRKSFSRQ
jgi:hypothetical protein